MKSLLKIGDIAKLFDINIRTLRYYDEINLLKPDFVDEQTGYRYYAIEQFEKLNTIKYLRALDCSIEKIKDFFENRDVKQILVLLDEQKKEIQLRQHQLAIIEKKINNRINQITDASESRYGVVEVKHLEKREYISLKKEISIHSNIEMPIKELQSQYRLESNIFLGKVGLSISKENLLRKDFLNYSSLFILVEENENHIDNDYMMEANYVCIRFKGRHNESTKYYYKLIEYIYNNNYEIAGDALELTLVDYGLTNDIEQFVTEIQIPIKTS